MSVILVIQEADAGELYIQGKFGQLSETVQKSNGISIPLHCTTMTQ